ncbi:MAG: hypothetical protein ACE5KI_00910 [Dehalococcoidia bacterium]
MYRPTALELKVLKALIELGTADGRAVGSRIGLGSEMSDYLCRYLTTKELVQRVGRKYALTSLGQRALEEAFARVLSILRTREGEVMETLAKIRLP